MRVITVTAIVDKNHRLVIDLPDDVLPGRVEVTISTVDQKAAVPNGEQPKPSLTREEARARLLAAGLIDEDDDADSPDALEVSEEELERLSKVFSSERSIAELIDEDREDRA